MMSNIGAGRIGALIIVSPDDIVQFGLLIETTHKYVLCNYYDTDKAARGRMLTLGRTIGLALDS